MATVFESKLLTAEEYGRLPDDGRLTELVRGRVVEILRPFTSHGFYMSRIVFLLTQFVEQHGSGRIVGGGGLVTQRDPDSVRGPDVAFYSYQRMPRGPLPGGYWAASPNLVIEILSNRDRSSDIDEKVAEYLGANVLTVAVIDPASQRAHVHCADIEMATLTATDFLKFPDQLPGFEVLVGRLFE